MFERLLNKLTNKAPEEQKNNIKEVIEEVISDEDSFLLNNLDIKADVEIDALSIDDIRNKKFDLVAPTGFDPKQVEKFMDIVEKSIYAYRQAIISRNADLKKALAELDNVQKSSKRLMDQVELEKLNNLNSQEDLIAELQLEIMGLKNDNKILKEDNIKLSNEIHQYKDDLFVAKQKKGFMIELNDPELVDNLPPLESELDITKLKAKKFFNENNIPKLPDL